MMKLEANVKKMKERLQRWDAKLEVLMVKIEHHQQVDVIEARCAQAQVKFDQRAADSEKWDSFQAGIEIAWKDLETVFNELILGHKG